MSKSMIPDEITGYRSESINGLIRCVRALWPRKSATLLIDVLADGARYEVKRPGSGSASIAMKKPFDLANKMGDTFSVMDNLATSYGINIAGGQVTIKDGVNLTYDTDQWKSETVTESIIVYLKASRSTPDATIDYSAGKDEFGFYIAPADDDLNRHYPLYYIPFASAKITWSDVIDLRGSIMLAGMA